MSLRRRQEHGVATLTLDRPGRRNALSPELLGALDAALAEAATDPGVRVVVLAGEGPVFCSGNDLGAVGRAPEATTALLARVLRRLVELPRPVVVRCQGGAWAGGIGLLGAADIVLAGADARFAFPEVRLGVSPAIVAAAVLPRADGRLAQRYLLTGEELDARAAARLGLVSTVVAPGDLDAELAAVVAALRAGAPEALAATKAALGALRGHPTEADWEAAVGLSAAMFASESFREGLAARRQGRPPAWEAPGAP